SPSALRLENPVSPPPAPESWTLPWPFDPVAPPWSSVAPAPPQPSRSSSSSWLISCPSPPLAPPPPAQLLSVSPLESSTPFIGSTMGRHHGCGLGPSCLLPGFCLHHLHPGLYSGSLFLPGVRPLPEPPPVLPLPSSVTIPHPLLCPPPESPSVPSLLFLRYK
ncbi:hypothetical protein M9458_043420, partial [Cirrhinus mrigala]